MNIRTYALSALLVAAGLPMAAQAGNASAQLQVKLIIDGACNVSTNDVDFGTIASLAGGASTTGSVKLTCTNGMDYTIAIGPGAHGTVAARKMSDGSGVNEIGYNLHHTSASGDIWGNTTGSGISMVSDTGTGAQQEHTIFGVIPATSPSPANGSYSDNLSVTVTW